MAYYFIGTDKELEKAGFTFVLDAEILAIRRRDNGNDFIKRSNYQVICWGPKFIQDLIDKKLIVIWMIAVLATLLGLTFISLISIL